MRACSPSAELSASDGAVKLRIVVGV